MTENVPGRGGLGTVSQFPPCARTRARMEQTAEVSPTLPTARNAQLQVTDYERAATVLWGPAGAYAVQEYARINGAYFDDQLPALPIVIGITAYGGCIGLTRGGGTWEAGHRPRITIASNLFARGRNHVTDALLHEMIHVRLILAGESPDHNAAPWCAEITRLSPAVLGHPILAAPVKPRRVDGKVVRKPLDGHLPLGLIAHWPFRGPEWQAGQPIDVETY